ncbi:hypothetical protein SETIT_9G047000v2 [Setaria italica]|uniref:Pheophorbide a oxygenase domain-containing protein n=1 Tax=Setaria italica TaxID=4555 RepID=A0A368SD48_SETIT|nr:hypothetical protein SETIT_9G047000v2 [Setaria italica]
MFVIFCVPVSPGRSRLIWLFPRNGGVWLHKITPRFKREHCAQRVPSLLPDGKILLKEHNFAAVGLDNWHQACYVPTSSDGMVIAFRNWFRRHCKNQIVWATPQVDQLPSIKTKDKLLDR